MTDELNLNVNIIPNMSAVDAALKKPKSIISKLPGHAARTLLSKVPGYEKPPKTMKKLEMATGDPFAAFKREKTQVGRVGLDPLKKLEPLDKKEFKKLGKLWKIDLYWRWIKGAWNVLLKTNPILQSLMQIFDAAMSLISMALLYPFLNDIIGVLKILLAGSAGFFKWMKDNAPDFRQFVADIIAGLAKLIIVSPATAAKIAKIAAELPIIGKLKVLGEAFVIFGNLLKSLIPKEFKEAWTIASGAIGKFTSFIGEKLSGPLKAVGEYIEKKLGVDFVKLGEMIGEKGLMGALKKAASFILGVANPMMWGSLVGDILGIIGQAGEWVFGDIPWLKDFFENIKTGGQFFSELLEPISWVIAGLQDLYSLLTGGPVTKLGEKLTKVSGAFGDWWGTLTNQTAKTGKFTNVAPEDLPSIKKFATGGIVNQPTIGMIAEAGPEAVIPLDQMKGMGSTSITVNGLVDEYKFRSIIREEIEKSNRRLFNARGAVSI